MSRALVWAACPGVFFFPPRPVDLCTALSSPLPVLSLSPPHLSLSCFPSPLVAPRIKDK